MILFSAMCSSSLRIVNRSLTYRPSFDKLYVEVPCNRCADCIRKKHSEWFVRTYYAIKSYRQSMLFTLTYNDASLPYFRSKVSPETSPIMCFSYAHIKLFLDELRKYLLRHNIIRQRGMAFFVCCEYGSDPDGTHRPHYHVVLLFNPCITRIPPSLIHDLVSRFWASKYGFIYPRYRMSPKIEIISSYKAANYVSKYVSKDIDFFDQPAVKAFLDKSLQDDEYQKRFDEIKPFLPGHWQSHGYGLGLLDDIYNGDVMDSFMNGVKILGSDFSYPLPGYIKDKMLYTYKVVDGHRLRFLTEFGKMFLVQKFNSDFSQYSFRLNSFFTRQHLLSLFPESFYLDRFKMSLSDINQLYKRVSDKGLFNLYCYEKLYRNYTMPMSRSPLGRFRKEEIFPYSFDENTPLNEFSKVYDLVLLSRLNKPQDIDLVENSARKVESYYFKSFQRSDGVTGLKVSRFYNDLPQFTDFEALIALFYKIKACDIVRSADRQLSDERKFLRIRKKYKKYD